MSFDALDLYGPTPPTSPDRPLVKRLIRRLGVQEATYVVISPEAGCIEGDCFNNVTKLVGRYGGAMITGWCIWELPKLFARAEHHAIWQRPNGLCVDPTPKDGAFCKILFIPDHNSPWDGPGHKAKRSIWQANQEKKDAWELVRLETLREDLLEKKSLSKDNTELRKIDSKLAEVTKLLSDMDHLLYSKGLLKLR
ncbi:MAG: hypothetical protein P4L90_00545 [Rhodopila sp.]|nr:hypothetical protein [Rhodopila sp.]